MAKKKVKVSFEISKDLILYLIYLLLFTLITISIATWGSVLFTIGHNMSSGAIMGSFYFLIAFMLFGIFAMKIALIHYKKDEDDK